MTGHTARSFLFGFERLMVVENQPPWAPGCTHFRDYTGLKVDAKVAPGQFIAPNPPEWGPISRTH